MGKKITESHLSCFTGAVEEDKIYTVDITYGWLIEYNTRDYTHRILTKMSCMHIKRGGYYIRKIIKVGDMLYFFLGNSRDIISWSLSQQVFKIYGNEYKFDQQFQWVSNAFLVKDKIWICPAYSNQPLRCFDVNTQKISEYSFIEEQLSLTGIILKESQFVFASLENKILWFAIYNTPYVVSYNVERDRWNCYSFYEFGKVSNLSYDGNDLWIYFMDRRIFISWRPERGVLDIYEVSDMKLDMSKGDPYSYIYGFQNNIFVIPTYDNDIYIVNRKTKKEYLTNFVLNYERIYTWPYVPLFYACIPRENRLILLPYSVNVIVEINMEDGQIQCIESKFDYGDLWYCLGEHCQKKKLIENDQITLKEYISYIEFRENVSTNYEDESTFGRYIFDKAERK